MKTRTTVWIFSGAILALLLAVTISCSKNDEDPPSTGVLEFRTLNPLTSGSRNMMRDAAENPALVGDTTETINTSFKLGVGDIWVSKGEVKAGNSDNLEWVRLTSVTNQEIKLFEDYVFQPKALPVGTYKSIKITLKNRCYRYVELADNPSIKYELLETMGSSFASCDENDNSWVEPNYFSSDGNHKLNGNGKFELVSAGEKIAGFTIESGETAVVQWRLGAGSTEPCINYLIDENGNREWNCGVDYIEVECPESAEYMFDFVVSYE